MPDDLSLDDFEEKARERHGIPKGLWESLKGQENSSGDPNETSPTGVRGRFQVTKRTAAGFGLDRDDPFEQAVAAAKYLREGYDKYPHIKDENQRWLAAAGRYYGGDDAVAPDGTLSTKSRDNLSTPAKYVTGIATKWGEFNRSQTQNSPPPSTGAPPSNPRLAERTTTSSISQPKTAPPPRPDLSLPGASNFGNIGARAIEESRNFERSPEQEKRLKRRDEIQAMPALRRAKYELGTAARQGFAQINDLGQNISELANPAALSENMRGIRAGLTKAAATITPQIVAPQVGAQADADLEALQRERDARRVIEDPSYQDYLNKKREFIERSEVSTAETPAGRLGLKVGRGVVQGAVGSAPQLLAGNVPGAVAITAAGSDYTRPQEAAVNIAGAALPVAAGRAVAPAAETAARALPRLAPAIRAGVPVTTGAATNVASALALGETDPEKLAETAIVGGLMSAPDAYRKVRGGREFDARTRAVAAEPPPAPQMIRPESRQSRGYSPTEVTKLQGPPTRQVIPRVMDQPAYDAEYARLSQPGGTPRDRAAAIQNLAAQDLFRQDQAELRGLSPADQKAELRGLSPDLVAALLRRDVPIGGPNIPQGGEPIQPPTEGMYGARRRPAPAAEPLGRPQTGAVAPTPQTEPQLARGMYGGRPNPKSRQQLEREAAQSNIANRIGEIPAESVPRNVSPVNRTAPIEEPRPTLQPAAVPSRLRPQLTEGAVNADKPVLAEPALEGVEVSRPGSQEQRLLPPVERPRLQPATALVKNEGRSFNKPEPIKEPVNKSEPLRAQQLVRPGKEPPFAEPPSAQKRARNDQPGAVQQSQPQRGPTIEYQKQLIERATPENIDRYIKTLERQLPGRDDGSPEWQAKKELLERANERRAEMRKAGQVERKYEPTEQPIDYIPKAERADDIVQPIEEQRRRMDVRRQAKAERLTSEKGRANEATSPETPQVAQEAAGAEPVRPQEGIPAQSRADAGQGGKEAAPGVEPYAIHQDYGPVRLAEKQNGVPRGKVRVIAERDGKIHIINKRSQNQRAIITKGESVPAERPTSSAVKDIPLYHGTRSGDIGTIDAARFVEDSRHGPGFYLTQSPEMASEYTGETMARVHLKATADPKPAVYKMRADIRKPFDIDAGVDPGVAKTLLGRRGAGLTGSGLTNADLYSRLVRVLGSKRAANQALEKAGFDGIKAVEDGFQTNRQFASRAEALEYQKKTGGALTETENGQFKVEGHMTYVAFRPEQVSSAFEEQAPLKGRAVSASSAPLPGSPMAARKPITDIPRNEYIRQQIEKSGTGGLSQKAAEAEYGAIYDQAAAKLKKGAAPKVAPAEKPIAKTAGPAQPPKSEPAPSKSSGSEEAILNAMVKVKPEAFTGSAASIKEMRAASGLSREEFDKTILRMADNEEFVLQRHDFPSSLPEAERNNLIRRESPYGDYRDPETGKRYMYYVGAGLRNEAGSVKEALDRFVPKQGLSFGKQPGETSGGTTLGSGFGGLQSGFGRRQPKAPAAPPPRGNFQQRNAMNRQARAQRASQAANPPNPSKIGRAAETVGAAQTVAQLATPGFVVRNILQHGLYGSQEKVVNTIGSAVDQIVSLAGGRRAAVLPDVKGLTEYWNGAKAAIQAQKQGKAPPQGNPLYSSSQTQSTNKVGRALDRVLYAINEVPDAGNYARHFARSVDSITKSAKRSGVNIAPDDIIAQAKLEADYLSFRNKNVVSNALGKFKETLNAISEPVLKTKKFGLGDFVVKYSQIPGAIAERAAVDYSPLGILKAGKKAVEAIQTAKSDPAKSLLAQREATLTLGRVLTGSGATVGLGAAMAAAGVLVGPDDKKKNIALDVAQGETGRRGYSLNLSALWRMTKGMTLHDKTAMTGEPEANDLLVPVEWAQPVAMQAAVGTELYKRWKSGQLGLKGGVEATAEAGAESLTGILDHLSDQTVLKNLDKYRQAIGRDRWEDAVKAIADTAVKQVAGSFTPGLLRQARNAVDPLRRDIRAEQPKGMKSTLIEAGKQVVNSTPLSPLLPSKASLTTGKEGLTRMGDSSALGRIIESFSPLAVNRYQPDAVISELGRLQRSQPKANLSMAFPGRLVEEPTSSLRGREFDYAKKFKTEAQTMIDNPGYQELDDESKLQALGKLFGALRKSTYKESEYDIEEILSRAADKQAKEEDDDESVRPEFRRYVEAGREKRRGRR